MLVVLENRDLEMDKLYTSFTARVILEEGGQQGRSPVPLEHSKAGLRVTMKLCMPPFAGY